MKLRSCFVLLSVLTGAQAFSQTDWKTKFPDAEAVYTNLVCEVNIKKENGKLVAVSEFSEDLVYLHTNAVQMMSKGYIYHSSFNELKKWDAYTQVPDEKKKLKVSNTSTASSRQSFVFYDDVKSTSFDYTGGTIGATRHLDYELYSNDVFLLSPYYFERYFPVAQGELRISFPSDVKLKYITKGLNKDKIKFNESQKKDRTVYSFQVIDLKGEKNYSDAPDNSYYATHLIFFVEQVKESGEWKNFLSSPQDLYKRSYNYIRDINKSISDELKNITDSVTRGKTSTMEKARAIYGWVQSHIKYVAFEEGMEGFIPREANLVCSRRFGDCKDMASILTSMLNYAGVPAYFTWIGTRDIPYDYTEVPLPIVDNHMICAIKNGNDFIFLDGTDDGCIFGMPPHHLQDKQAMIGISENEFKIVRVPVIPKEKNQVIDTSFIELTDKGITGKVKIQLKGYYASSMHSILNYKNEKEREEFFKAQYARASNKIKFSNWKVSENQDHSETLITADFELPDYGKKLGDEWYLNLNLFKWYEHGEIDFPKRKIPIEFAYLKHSSYVTAVKIPEGFQLGFVPKSDSFKNEVWGFDMNYATSKDWVYLNQEFETRQLMLYPNQFESWNKVLERLFPNYKQTVSFRKK